ncbi:MAG: polyhydroxyalkanoate synthesis repressor PhaR [Gammaproteobacteria bacterium]
MYTPDIDQSAPGAPRKKEPVTKRIIKKYPNRRLYDTVESKYITVDDVRKLVLKGIEFCIVDKKSGEDITRTILLQIILEQEEDGEPMFSSDALTRIIRFYGDAVQGLASSFLDRSLNMFAEQQERFRTQLHDAMRTHPFTALTELTQQNLQLWRKMQDDFFKASGVSSREDTNSKDKRGGDN